VSKRLHRYYGTHDLHFITSSCYRRQPELGSAWRRDLFVKILEEARRKYGFVVHGYVVMPEHIHLLITEPDVGDPSVVMKVIKERFSRRVNRRRRQAAGEQGMLWERIREPVWQKAVLRFQCLERAQTGREAALHAPQSSEARTGGASGTMEVEQLPRLLLWRSRTGEGEVSRIAAGNQAPSGRELSRSREPSHLQSAQMTGAPSLSWAPGRLFGRSTSRTIV
jgi:REP element-mobilizing transposase RayT